jgi:hypothetical protein
MFFADELGWLDPCRGVAVDEEDVIVGERGRQSEVVEAYSRSAVYITTQKLHANSMS